MSAKFGGGDKLPGTNSVLYGSVMSNGTVVECSLVMVRRARKSTKMRLLPDSRPMIRAVILTLFRNSILDEDSYLSQELAGCKHLLYQKLN